MNFKLCLLFDDDSMKEIIVKRFSDLSASKSKFYYYEEPYDEHGKGSCVLKDKVKCFEVIING